MPMRRENVAAALRYLQDKADLRGRLQRATSLDPQEQDLADIAVETGASLVPGVGPALAARDFERARRADDPAGMAMAAANVVPGGKLAGLLKRYDPAMARIAEYDPRFDLRVKEQKRLKALEPVIESRGTVNPREISITELEGRPFIISQSDRTAAGGVLKGINDVTLNQPVVLRGGQDFMFENPGMVWASGKSPVSRLQKMAAIAKKETGQDPLLLPYRMTPSGGDFAAMTGEAMLNYADAALSSGVKREINSKIKNIIPDWAGLGTEKGIEQYQKSSQAKRNAVRKMLDKDYREVGGLNIGEARLSVTDPRQYTAADTGLQNVGVMYAGQPTITQSGHPSYPFGVPGEGMGRLKEDVKAFELLPELAAARRMDDPRKPNAQDYRSLMVPRAGILTDDILKRMGF
jgi:hypothetical protein